MIKNEEKFLTIALSKPEHLEKIVDQVSEENERKVRKLIDFYKLHGSIPSYEVLKNIFPGVPQTQPTDADIQWLIDEWNHINRTKFLGEIFDEEKHPTLTLPDVTSAWNKFIIEEDKDKHINITLDKNDIFADLKNMEETDVARISTGFSQLDCILSKSGYAGWIAGYTYLFQGLTGTNKTFILINFAVKQLLAGKKVLYISSEMNKAQVDDRLYRSLLLAENVDQIKAKLLHWNLPIQYAFISYGRSSASALTIENDLVKLPWTPDVIVLDYLDILLPTRKYQQSWEAQAIISDDLSRLAQKLNIPILTASQTNRSAAHDKLKGTKDFQGYETTGSSFNKTHQFAAIWNIRTNENDYDPQTKTRKLDLQCIKNRDGEEATSTYFLDYNTCRLFEFGSGHPDAGEEKFFANAQRIMKKTTNENEETSEETLKNYNKYYENLKDSSTYKEDIDTISNTYLNKKQKEQLKRDIREYQTSNTSTVLRTKNLAALNRGRYAKQKASESTKTV